MDVYQKARREKLKKYFPDNEKFNNEKELERIEKNPEKLKQLDDALMDWEKMREQEKKKERIKRMREQEQKLEKGFPQPNQATA